MGVFSRKAVGNSGEITAVKFLKKNKYKIITTNYKAKVGEIDIICENKEYIVFVEVKTRKSDSIISGIYSVDKRKQNHILKTASSFLNDNKTDKQPRFDIIEVEYLSDGTSKVKEHFENAFIQGGSYGVF